MKFLKWIWLVVILGAIAGVGNMLRERQRIKKIREEVRKNKAGIEERSAKELADAENVDTVPLARSSLARMRNRAKQRRTPGN